MNFFPRLIQKFRLSYKEAESVHKRLKEEIASKQEVIADLRRDVAHLTSERDQLEGRIKEMEDEKLRTKIRETEADLLLVSLKIASRILQGESLTNLSYFVSRQRDLGSQLQALQSQLQAPQAYPLQLLENLGGLPFPFMR